MGTRAAFILQSLVTAPAAEKLFECHKQYIDIQYLVSGEEQISYARGDLNKALVEDRLADKDYQLFDNVEGLLEIRLTPGMFVVFFPYELHRPGCCIESSAMIKKAVVKIDTFFRCSNETSLIP